MNADNRQQIVIGEIQISPLIRTAEISINRKAEMLMRNMADNAHVMSFMRA
jgi:hypothetical protein